MRVECEAENITFKDDNAVSRLSVRDLLYANAYELEYPDGSSEYVINRDEAIKYLMELPSVYPKEPKTGHWITIPDIYGVTFCSECDFELRIDDTKYCPNCGAKMVKPQESEDKE